MRAGVLRRLVTITMVLAWAPLLVAQLPEPISRPPTQIVPPPNASAPSALLAPDLQVARVAADLLTDSKPAIRDVTWRGLVIGPDLELLAGVTVWLYPDGATIEASGHAPQLAPDWNGLGSHRPALLDALALSDCAQVASGADGSFAITGRLIGKLRSTGVVCSGSRSKPNQALLVLAAPGHSVRVVSTYRWDQKGSSVDLGGCC